jgi:hypothetical protein
LIAVAECGLQEWMKCDEGEMLFDEKAAGRFQLYLFSDLLASHFINLL